MMPSLSMADLGGIKLKKVGAGVGSSDMIV